MATRETFGALCQRVCEQQGWTLGPGGVRVDLPGGRRQVVSLEFFEHERRELVRLATEIGDAETLSPERLAMALQINARLAYGTLAVRQARLIMTATLLLHAARAEEIEATLAYLAETADYYEKMLFRKDEN